MRKLILAVLVVGLTSVASASDYYNGSYCVDYNGNYRMIDEDGNNIHISQASKYKPWKYTDGNGFAYTVMIKK